MWLPYTLRKMDHAFMMGRKAKWAENGRLDRRPSQIFREHFIVAPYPEENVQRVVAEVGIEPIVFGSDFPHGEGLARPAEYVDAQLVGFSDDESAPHHARQPRGLPRRLALALAPTGVSCGSYTTSVDAGWGSPR